MKTKSQDKAGIEQPLLPKRVFSKVTSTQQDAGYGSCVTDRHPGTVRIGAAIDYTRGMQMG